MAITKILARKGRLDVGIRYVLNGDKTEEIWLQRQQRQHIEDQEEVRAYH